VNRRQARRFTTRVLRTSKQTNAGWELVMARIVLREKTAKNRAEHMSPKPPLSALGRILAMMLAFAGTVAFAVVLARLTLEPSAASVPLTHSNLRPGDSIRAYLAQPTSGDTVKQLGGNIVMGIPFGVLLPVLVPRTRGLLRVAAATALVMILVELVQGALITGRAFDIDDVLLNTTGALIGYLLIGLRLGRAVHPRRRHWWHRFTNRQVTSTDPA
jgi:glycopeptide antibiotics resistance protein